MTKDANVRKTHDADSRADVAHCGCNFRESEAVEAGLPVFTNKLAIASFIVHYPDEEAPEKARP